VASKSGVAIFLLQIVRPFDRAPDPVLDEVSKAPQPRGAQIGGIVGQPANQRRRPAEIVAVTRWIRREARIGAANQLRFVGAVVFPGDRDGAGMLGHRPFEKRQRYKAESIIDVVDPAIPGAATKIMVKPF